MIVRLIIKGIFFILLIYIKETLCPLNHFCEILRMLMLHTFCIRLNWVSTHEFPHINQNKNLTKMNSFIRKISVSKAENICSKTKLSHIAHLYNTPTQMSYNEHNNTQKVLPSLSLGSFV